MPECPSCLGEGGHDFRYLNAHLQDHLTDEELARVPNMDVDWADCTECEGTAVVSEERAAELREEARVAVEKVLAWRETNRC